MFFKKKKYQKLILMAKECFSKEDLEQSAKYYEEAFKIKVYLPDYIMYGYILIDLEEYNKARHLFETMEEDFDVLEINFALANIYERLNIKDQAISKYEQVIQKNHEFEPAHFSLAYIYDDMSEDSCENIDGEHVKKAIYHYNEVIKLDDNNFWAHLNIGSIYERFNVNDLALEHFLKAYEINNKKEMVCYNLGVVYYKLKDYNQSLKYYLEELTQEKPFKNTYYNLGILYKDGFKDYEKAKYYYLKGLEDNHDEYNIWYNLGCIHTLLNDYENAFDCFKYIYYKNKKYLDFIDKDKELEEFRKTKYYALLKNGL